MFAYSLSQAARGYYRGMLGLQRAIENPEPSPGLLERDYRNMQGDAAVAEILGLDSMEEDDREEEMPEEDSPDEDSGFHVDRSIHHRRTDRLRELREEAEAEVSAIQRRADAKGITFIGSA
jgi:hypothetical protein